MLSKIYFQDTRISRDTLELYIHKFRYNTVVGQSEMNGPWVTVVQRKVVRNSGEIIEFSI